MTWFGTLFRLWCLRKGAAAPGGSPVPAVVALGLLWVTVWVVIDWWQRRPEPVFYLDGIPLLAWYALGVVATASWLKWRSSPRPVWGAATILILGLLPLPLFIEAVLATAVEPRIVWLARVAAVLYGFVYLSGGLRLLTGRSQRSSPLSTVVCIAAFIWASITLDVIPDVWNPQDADASMSDDSLLEREDAMFEQADRIDERLETIHRSVSKEAQFFFLGFAGVGDEKVFAQEISLASRVLGERYDIDGRHLSLINDERDLTHAPLANVSGLTYALKGMASRMDVKRDVLLLSLSSHGSEDPSIAVANSQIPFKNLTTEDLADALRESGIKWRVIIISACYAGGFIKSLSDPDTIVITAAAADRTSFGCSNDSDLTYFGEAFYRDALPGAVTLREAFNQATKSIAAREQLEGEKPSNPQAYFGAALEAKLAAMADEGTAVRGTTKP